MKNIIWLRPDGVISISRFADDSVDSAKEATAMQANSLVDAAWKAVAFDIPDDQMPEVIRHEDLRWDGKKLVCDIGTARESTKLRLRAERAAPLQMLDVDYMRAIESGDSKKQASIAKAKQSLRDITKKVDGATDLTALRAISV